MRSSSNANAGANAIHTSASIGVSPPDRIDPTSPIFARASSRRAVGEAICHSKRHRDKVCEYVRERNGICGICGKVTAVKLNLSELVRAKTR
jgi:hypothetical protein